MKLYLNKLRYEIEARKKRFFKLLKEVIRFWSRLCVVEEVSIKQRIVIKTHLTLFSVHLGIIV